MAETILIIDDHEEILDFLSDILADDYEVVPVSDAEKALDILNNQMISLIVSDIMMPGMDGFQLCEIIKSNVDFCHIPLILLTAKNSYQAQINGLEVGADAYVQKPFSPQILQLQIANLLKNRSKIRQHFANSPFEDTRVIAQSKTDEIFLRKLDDFIQKNLDDVNLDIDQLADFMNMSRPTFYRKIKALSSLSPKELVNITRLKKAASLIAENNYKLFEISQMTGYSSQSIFGKNFQKHFGKTPLEYYNSLKEAD